jgi:two-component system CheB/CheR fusion protein
MHDGTIEARSAGPDKGSEFIVRLPIASRQTTAAPESEVAALPKSPARRILIVDDNLDSAESLEIWLKLLGHEVQVAHEGLTAVEMARSFHPEVVVLDIGLPDIDGYEVAARLRQEPDLKEVLLIAVTGYGQEVDRLRSYSAGFNEHLVKPVDPASLESILAAPKEKSNAAPGATEAGVA